jgi:hypothetical protein
MFVSLRNVPFGWQLIIEDTVTGDEYALGPVHNGATEAWKWQAENLVKIAAKPVGIKKKDLVRIKPEFLDDFAKGDGYSDGYSASDMDYYTKNNEWQFRYMSPEGWAVVWHNVGDDTEYWLRPEWVEKVSGSLGEHWDNEEARMPYSDRMR